MKNFTFIIVGFVIGVLCINIVIFFVGRRKTQPIIYENNSREKKMEHVMQKQFELEHRPLVLTEILSDSLNKYINNNTILVFYFNDNSCDPCTDSAIADLINYKEKIGKQNILVIISVDNRREAMLLTNQVKDHFNTLWIKNNEMQFEGIAENSPIHFFLLDRTMVPFCLYFYMPEFPTLNKEYFNIVAKRILNNEE